MRKDKTIRHSEKRKPEKDSAPHADSQRAAGGDLHQIAGGEHPAPRRWCLSSPRSTICIYARPGASENNECRTGWWHRGCQRPKRIYCCGKVAPMESGKVGANVGMKAM